MITMMTTLLISTQLYKCSRRIPKMMYSPHFKDKLLPIKKNLNKTINDNPKDYYKYLTVDKISMVLT